MRAFLVAALAVVAFASPSLAADFKKLLAPGELAAIRGEVTILDIRSPSQYALGHVEGARNAPYPVWRGPKNNPGLVLSDAALTDLLQGLGIGKTDWVVVTYHGKDATDFGAAARVYWTLKSAGLTELAILNGGLVAWIQDGHALSKTPPEWARSSDTYTLSDEWTITRDGVRAVVDGKADAQIIDARPVAFLQGKRKHPAAKVAGTIDGAAQLTHSTWFDKDNDRKVGSIESVVRLAREAGVETGDTRPIASFCNTGHWAATNWFALSELAGIRNVKLYPESMVGWTNADQPVVTRK